MAKRKRKNNKVVVKLPIWALLVLIVVGAIVFVIYYLFIYEKDKEEVIESESESYEVITGEDGCLENMKFDDFQIHFLELGNDKAGDSIYIKAGNNDILIDAGSRSESAVVINEYISNYCDDGILEYVIATHNHQDHIAGFAGKGITKYKNYKGESISKSGVFYYYDVLNLIDFTYAEVTIDKKAVTFVNKEQKSENFGSGTEYGKYLAARENLIERGTNYKTAKDLWDSNNTTIDLGNNISMDILYNYYYFNESKDVNNYSVCTMFNYNSHHFMLTGDLEKDGETKLAEYYDGSTKEKTLPHVDLFKAGHHGSKTSSNDVLLSKITPSCCVCCCCAGSTEYSFNNDAIFPTQDFIDRIAKYTDRVYVTSLYDKINNTNISFNGNVIVSSDGKDYALFASNNLTKLKDTEWFNEDIYLVDGKVYDNTNKKFYDETYENAIKTKQRIWPSYGR